MKCFTSVMKSVRLVNVSGYTIGVLTSQRRNSICCYNSPLEQSHVYLAIRGIKHHQFINYCTQRPRNQHGLPTNPSTTREAILIPSTHSSPHQT